MTRCVEIRESSPQPLELSATEAGLLNKLGTQLASQSRYWRDLERDGDAATIRKRSVITCSYNGDAWTIFVSNAVGIVRVGDLQIVVRPKIPLSHFIHLLSFSELAPRTIAEPVNVDQSQDFLELIALWFMSALDGILRRGMVLDYTEMIDTLPAVRGQLNPMPTAEAFYSGRFSFDCRFDDFSEDTPLNRVLRAAAAKVLSHEDFSKPLRRRAFLALERLGTISDLKPSDMLTKPDRRTAHYSDGLMLARLLLTSEARTIQEGNREAWSFLIPTAGPIEEGIRTVLARALAPSILVSNHGKQLWPSRLTINPDLVFDPHLAVGDVKYKMYGSDWSRPDLYQVVAFASGYGAKRAIVVSFSDRRAPLPALRFDNIAVANAVWETNLEPEEASRRLIKAVQEHLNSSRASAA